MLRLPPGAALDEMLEASELFLAAYPFAPGAVPGPLRETCASMTGPDPDASHVIWQHEAIDLLDEAGRTGDLEAVDQAIGLLSAATLAWRAGRQLDAIEAALEPLPTADDLMKADDDIVAARRAELTAEREAVLAQIRRLP